MRIDARTGDRNWEVFHVPTCSTVSHTVWVDTDAAVWAGWFERPSDGELIKAFRTGEFPLHHERRIVLVPHQRMVLIDPLDDAEGEPTVNGESLEEYMSRHARKVLALMAADQRLVRGTGCKR